VLVRGLDPDPPRAREAVEDEVAAAAEDAGLETVDVLLHLHGVVAIDPPPASTSIASPASRVFSNTLP
jgi:hypothetical protein